MKKQTFLINLILSFLVGLTSFLIISYNANDDVMANAIDESNTDLTAEIVEQLKAAKTADEKYRTIDLTLADDYVDINAIQQHMGVQLLTAELPETVFNHATPQILVYNK